LGIGQPAGNPELSVSVASQVTFERRFWENDPFERPGVDSLENLLNKSVDLSTFNDIVSRYAPEFARAASILEVGGGQGWASCVVKRRFPAARVTVSDAVDAAIAGRPIWERVFNTRLDASVAAPAQELPVADESINLLFCFAAAHHFVDHDAALREAYRVLAPNGVCLWLYEPTSPALLHRLAESRVNRKRVDVPEHVLVPEQILAKARAAGFDASVEFSPDGVRRGRLTAIYYAMLQLVPALARVLPCTAHFVFRKAASADD
jgi:ubiquinone/menaquinone biosynthesis C-methylase UbiE